MSEILLKIGEQVRDPREMTREELDKWHEQLAQDARKYLFSIGQPLVYERDGHVLAEHNDGRVELI